MFGNCHILIIKNGKLECCLKASNVVGLKDNEFMLMMYYVFCFLFGGSLLEKTPSYHVGEISIGSWVS